MKDYTIYLEGNSQYTKGKALTHFISDEAQAENKRDSWQWHKWLGHPSFSYLKRLFPSLFKHCHINNNRSNVPFFIIHSDVSGPALLHTHNGMRWFVTFVDDSTRMTWL